MRVAIVHYWLVTWGGGEKVVQVLGEMFPQADIFTVVATRHMAARYAPHRITTSFVQQLPGSHRWHRHFIGLYPLALEQFDLRGYDLVISSESGPAKGVITSPDACHITYCHSPMRYVWDQYHDYRRRMGTLARLAFGATAHYLRLWDVASAARVDHFVANSHNVAARIRKHYGREAEVIYPPVDTAKGDASERIDDYYLVVTRLVDYKRVDLAVAACRKLGRKLRIVGDGPERERLRRLGGSDVELLGLLSDEELNQQYAHCRAVLLPGEEDFGLVPVEAQSFGRPVIAYGRGGVLESVLAGTTGVFFSEQSVDSLAEALRRFEDAESDFLPAACIANAARFSADRFKREMAEFIARQLRWRNAETPALDAPEAALLAARERRA